MTDQVPRLTGWKALDEPDICKNIKPHSKGLNGRSMSAKIATQKQGFLCCCQEEGQTAAHGAPDISKGQREHLGQQRQVQILEQICCHSV